MTGLEVLATLASAYVLAVLFILLFFKGAARQRGRAKREPAQPECLPRPGAGAPADEAPAGDDYAVWQEFVRRLGELIILRAAEIRKEADKWQPSAHGGKTLEVEALAEAINRNMEATGQDCIVFDAPPTRTDH
jgi:hypothetical protein